MFDRKSFIKSTFAGSAALSMAPYVSAASTKKTSPKRFVFVRFCNGLLPQRLALKNLPDNLAEKEKKKQAYEVDLDKYELSDYLTELTPYKENMCILQGMSSRMAVNGHQSEATVMGLFGGDHSINSLKRTSIDYELGKLFPSPLGPVEVSFAKNRHGIVPGYSVPAPYQRNICYADPITAYNKLYQCVLDPESLTIDNDVLKGIEQDSYSLSRRRKGADKRAYENNARNFEKIQLRNKELLKMASKVSKFMPDKDMIFKKGVRTTSLVNRHEAMTEMVASILTAGLTNVVTYTIDSLSCPYSGLPGLESTGVNSHHVGHGQSAGGVNSNELRQLIRQHQLRQVKTLIERLKAQPEGNGTMFDNTTIMYFPEGGEKHHANGSESPWVVLSGKNCNLDMSGRYIRMPRHGTEGHQTLGNWYTTLLNAHGNPIHHYGDLDGVMTQKRLPQKGAIKRFIKA